MEELLSLIDKADSVNIQVNDLICMMLQIGIFDQGLQQELGSIREPTQAFNEKIEGYEQARKTTCNTAFGNAAMRGAAPPRPSNQGNHPTCPNIPCGRGERSRRVTLRGNFFHCAKSDHIIPQCFYPKTV